MKKLLQMTILLFLSITINAQIGGYALKFDGTDDYVNTGYIGDLNVFTVECWVKGTNAPAYTNKFPGVVHKEYNFEITWDHNEEDKRGAFVMHNNGSWHPASFGTLEANVWYHLAAVYDGQEMRAYKNGKLISTNTTPEGNPDFNDLATLIGKHANREDYFNGTIDEVRIWTDVRTIEEINVNMYKELTGDEANLVAYYKMSDGSGLTLTNNKTGGYATITGAAWSASGSFAGSRNALDFDGSNDYVLMPQSYNDAFDNLSHFSFCGWVYCADLETANSWGTFFTTFAGNGTTVRVTFHQMPDGYYGGKDDVLFSINNGTYGEAFTESNVLKVGVWQHFAVVYDGTQGTNEEKVKIYVDGILQKLNFKGSNFPETLPNTTATGYIGRYYYSDYFKGGKFDEFSFWNKSLTESEIHEMMFRNLSGSETNLFAYYRFDQYDGTTLYDLTVNGNNGTLTNMDASTDWVSSSAYNTWIGSESTDWATAGNWSNRAPVETDNVGLYKWALGSETTVASSSTVNNLLISSSATPELPTSFTVNGSFIIQNDINITGKTITLGSTGYLSEGINSLYGSSGTITTTRTLGQINGENVAGLGAIISSSNEYTLSNAGHTDLNGTYYYYDVLNGKNRYKKSDYYIYYNGLNAWYIYYHTDDPLITNFYYKNTNLGLNNEPPTDGWQFDANNLSQVPPLPTVSFNDNILDLTTITRGHTVQTQNSQNSIKRFYNITPTNNSGLNATLVFNYKEDELNGLDESDLKIFKETTPGSGVWSAQESSILDVDNNKLTLTGITSFSKYTAAENSAFPVELQSFSATVRNNKVLIVWQTATEINNYGFEIERAEIVDGKTGNFSKIGFVEGHGNSNTIIDYSFTDSKVSFGKYSYRLKQIDNDGKATYSKTVEVNTQIPTTYSLNQNYPNPFNPTTAISFTLPNNEFVSLKIYDVLGNEVTTLINKEMNAGMHKEILDATNLSSGVYFYKLQAGKFTETKKMILAK